MKHYVLCLSLATTAACFAQTSAPPAAPKATAKPATTSATGPKLPPGIPRVRGIVKTAFSLHYEDIKAGTGKDAEPNKVYKVHYTGYIASTGRKFDSSYDHKTVAIGKDGKPELDADGKPKMIDAQPLAFVQGFGRLIPGFDQGFAGMKVGGKRRLFIPWQLAYGARGRPGPTPDNPGIPPKSDLIFDVELVDVTDMPAQPTRPGMGIGPNGQPMRVVPHPPAPGTPGAPATPPAGATPPPAGATPQAHPATPTTPQTTPPTDKPQAR